MYEWVSDRNEGALTGWRHGLEKTDKALIDAKTLMLETAADFDSLPGFIAGPIQVGGRKYPGIYKIQMGRKIALRPLLCRGTEDNWKQLTFLIGAREQNRKFDPRSAPETAEKRRQDLLDGLASRRKYETPSEGPAN